MDTGQGRVLIRLYPLYGYWTGQGTDKAIPSVWILDRAGPDEAIPSVWILDKAEG